MARPPTPITVAIRSMPLDIPAPRVVEILRARGIVTSESNVRRVRGPEGRFARSRSITPLTLAIQSLPLDIPAPQVVKILRLRGIVTSESNVRRVRGPEGKAGRRPIAQPMWTATHQGSGVGFAAAAMEPAHASAPEGGKPQRLDDFLPAAAARTLEDLLRALAAELGLGRALDILREERASVRAILGK